MLDTDIDIDLADRNTALRDLRHVPAVELRNTQRVRHVCGVYFHDVPSHPLDGFAIWDYKTAEEKGYFKIDFINNTIYQGVRDESHLIRLVNTEPPWEAFDDPQIVAELAQISKQFDVVQSIRPRTIEDLAVCLALIRPGKSHLIGKPRSEIDREIWLPVGDYYFKRSHAIAFAVSVVVQLNLLIEQSNG